MEKIFSTEDRSDMRKAAMFLWIDEDYAVTFNEPLLDDDGFYLNRVIDKIEAIERWADAQV